MVFRFVLVSLALQFVTQHFSSGYHLQHQPHNVSFPNGFPENFTSDSVIDVQYASCKIITDRIVATAEGKFSRFCHGICNINETNAKLHRIETILTSDAENLKHRLIDLERILFNIHDILLRKADVSKSEFKSTAVGDTRRLREIRTYNGTVFITTMADGTTATAFVYYWRVDMFWRLTFADGRARSTPFYVSPRSYRIALAVRSDVATRTVRVAAVLATGEYDAQLRWPFAYRLRLSVLDQTDDTPEDIVSQIWDAARCGDQSSLSQQKHLDDGVTPCASMEFRHDVLTYRHYSADDSLLVKFTVFL